MESFWRGFISGIRFPTFPAILAGLLLPAFILFINCSDDKDTTAVTGVEIKSPLGLKMLGTWESNTFLYQDKLTFTKDGSYEGVKDDQVYSGFFTISGDSILTLYSEQDFNDERRAVYYLYSVIQVDDNLLKLQATGAVPITYRRSS